ncbi:MAG: DEAD/DEAH box helicase [Moraxellaceae bacterium]|nr:DEAD/DEAH box helicase [Moraxellaceae bacterium]
MISALTELGYQQATPVQQSAIYCHFYKALMWLQEQKQAQAKQPLLLPLLHSLHTQTLQTTAKGNQVRALVIAPTRELAIQIGQAINAYGQYLQPRLKVCRVWWRIY